MHIQAMGMYTPRTLPLQSQKRLRNSLQIFCFVLFLSPTFVASAQRGATAAGTCAVAHNGNNDVITIKNCGIGKAQADKIISLLKEILLNRNIPAMNAKLDQLIEIAGKGQQTTVNAPITQQNTGGCNQQVVGGNNNTNNCVPPERHLTPEQESGLELLASKLPDECQVKFNSADSGEAQAFSKEIHDAFAKQKKVPDPGWGIGWHPKFLIAVRVNSESDPCAPYGLVLAKGIQDLGIGFSGAGLNERLPGRTVEIVVGER